MGLGGQASVWIGKPRSAPVIQAKLEVGEPNDMFEREADRVAEEVIRMPEGVVSIGPKSPDRIQSKCASCASEDTRCAKCADEERLASKPQATTVTPTMPNRQGAFRDQVRFLQTKGMPADAPEITSEMETQLNGLKFSGQPLSGSIRGFFEHRFGYDFSTVRIHTNANAVNSVRAVGARAFTVGNDIMLPPNEYAPNTLEGKRLLAHELTHVVQQQSVVPLVKTEQRHDPLPAMPRTFARTDAPKIQRVIPCKKRSADDDKTAWDAYQKINMAVAALKEVVNDPAVDSEVKMAMAERIEKAITALQAYMKEIESQCEGQGSVGIASTTANPATALIAAFGALLLGQAAAMTLAERGKVKKLGQEMDLLGELAEVLKKKAPQESPLPPPVETEPVSPFPIPSTDKLPVPKTEPKTEPRTEPTEQERRRGRCRGRKKGQLNVPCPTPLPIEWPRELPPYGEVGLFGGFMFDELLRRTSSDLREAEGLGDPRGRKQTALSDEIKATQDEFRTTEDPTLQVPRPCDENEVDPNAVYDAHHIHPIYLGGFDVSDNLCALRQDIHQKGHPKLDDQTNLFDVYSAECGMCSGYLRDHPDEQLYYVSDRK
jgi:uncharacterized protein DUF4157